MLIFKPKKFSYIDTTTINIYLKCEEQILAIIPYNDYFDLRCDENRERCTLESKESLLNFCNHKLRKIPPNEYSLNTLKMILYKYLINQ